MTRSLVFGPLWALLLATVSTSLLLASWSPRSQGVTLWTPRPAKPLDCGDDRLIQLHLGQDGSAAINSYVSNWRDVVARMHLILEHRLDKQLFFDADRDLPTGQVWAELALLKNQNAAVALVPEGRLGPSRVWYEMCGLRESY